MSQRKKKKFAASLENCRKKARNRNRSCCFPGCNETAIRSHIFQKNGVLSFILKNGHLIAHEGDFFNANTFVFKRIGANNAFSFRGFCAKHDTEIFKVIEDVEIGSLDFNVYNNCLLFVMRGVYNELNSKIDVISFFKCLISSGRGLFNRGDLMQSLKGHELGKKDISDVLRDFWVDLDCGTETFAFKVKRMKRQELCLSSVINYETTEEMMDFRMRNGKEMERLTPVFFNFFPLDNCSILLVGYYKTDYEKIASYIDNFFGFDEVLAEICFTNLILFNCETWVCSEDLFLKKMKSVEVFFGMAAKFACNNTDERRLFSLNIFSDDFERQMESVFGSM